MWAKKSIQTRFPPKSAASGSSVPPAYSMRRVVAFEKDFSCPRKTCPRRQPITASAVNLVRAWYRYDRPQPTQTEPHERSPRHLMKLVSVRSPLRCPAHLRSALHPLFPTRRRTVRRRATSLRPVQRALHLRRHRGHQNDGPPRSAGALRLRLVAQPLGQIRRRQPNNSARRRRPAARELPALPWAARRQAHLLGRRWTHTRDRNSASSPTHGTRSPSSWRARTPTSSSTAQTSHTVHSLSAPPRPNYRSLR